MTKKYKTMFILTCIFSTLALIAMLFTGYIRISERDVEINNSQEEVETTEDGTTVENSGTNSAGEAVGQAIGLGIAYFFLVLFEIIGLIVCAIFSLLAIIFSAIGWHCEQKGFRIFFRISVFAHILIPVLTALMVFVRI